MIPLLDRARRRVLAHLALDKGALALLVAMSGVILLLLLGTQILDWYWLALLIAVSLGVGAYQLRNSIPTRYKIAQRIDRRLGLTDALSTAIHFSDHPEPGREAICESQRRDAESVASTVDLKQALPFHRSRFSLPAAGLVLVALGLFTVRYLMVGSFNLQPSLMKIAYEAFFAPNSEQAKNQAKRLKIAPGAFDPGNPDNPNLTSDLDPNNPLNSIDNPSAEGDPNAPDNSKQTADKGQSDSKGADKDGKADDQGKQGDSQNGKDSDKDGKEDGDDKQANNGSPDKNSTSKQSLMDKLKDALSNLMNKSNQGQGQKPPGDAKSQKSDPGDKKQKGDAQDQKGAESASADATKEGDSSQSDDNKSSQQPGQPSDDAANNGAGSKDGEKKLKEAKALEAMGKIAELLGQRAQNVTGEVMVEVGQTKQQLKTQFQTKQATHAEAGSEIHRDEIPLAEQPYIQRYFEEIHKPVPAKPKP